MHREFRGLHEYLAETTQSPFKVDRSTEQLIEPRIPIELENDVLLTKTPGTMHLYNDKHINSSSGIHKWDINGNPKYAVKPSSPMVVNFN